MILHVMVHETKWGIDTYVFYSEKDRSDYIHHESSQEQFDDIRDIIDHFGFDFFSVEDMRMEETLEINTVQSKIPILNEINT